MPRDLSEALRLYRLAAQQGNPKALINLAGMYHAGSGVAKDVKEAARLYRLAVDQGIADAMVNLGAIFIQGDGVPSDLEEGIRLYNLAAQQESSEAQMRLGNMYEHGLGVRQDAIEAVRWYNLAIQQGNPSAQYCLGLMLFHGRGGVPKDVQKASGLLQLAAGARSLQRQHFCVRQRICRCGTSTCSSFSSPVRYVLSCFVGFCLSFEPYRRIQNTLPPAPLTQRWKTFKFVNQSNLPRKGLWTGSFLAAECAPNGLMNRRPKVFIFLTCIEERILLLFMIQILLIQLLLYCLASFADISPLFNANVIRSLSK